MRTVLLITYHFPPSAASGAFRMLGLARHLPRFGWRSVVVAPPRLPLEPVDLKLAEQLPEDTVVCSVPYPEGRLARLQRRFAAQAIWLPPALKACTRAVERYRPEAVLTSGPPHWAHLLGWALKRRHGLPWLADFRDPWITNNESLAGRPLRHRWQAFWERRVFRRADTIIANAPRAGEALQSAFPEYARKIHIVTNGFDADSFPQNSAPPSSTPVRIVHAGELYLGRDPRPLLDALAKLDWSPGAAGWCLCFLGRRDDGGYDLVSEIRKRALEGHVELSGQVSYEQSLRDMAHASILLLLDTPGRRNGVPAKLYEYLGAGRPILALAESDSDTAWVLRESGMPHRIAPPGDRAKIAEALVGLIQGIRGQNSPGPDHERLAQFTREHMAERFAELLNEVIPDALVRADNVVNVAKY
jgi:glycosyltransferase involved in cell wall biosynthesis